jgi:hypothetical protein
MLTAPSRGLGWLAKAGAAPHVSWRNGRRARTRRKGAGPAGTGGYPIAGRCAWSAYQG